MAADAHRITRVLCDEFLFFVFLAEALKKNKVCPVVEKRSRQILKRLFLHIRTVLGGVQVLRGEKNKSQTSNIALKMTSIFL